VTVYKQSDLETESFKQDFPINLADESYVKSNIGSLPHMRFLLSNKQMLEMTFLILLTGP